MMPGGQKMPALYDRIHRHIVAAGHPKDKAWAITVAAVAKGCLSGRTSFPNHAKFGAIARVEYCKAYAEWKRNHPKGSGLGKNPVGRG